MARASSPTHAPPSDSIVEGLGGPFATNDIALDTTADVSA